MTGVLTLNLVALDADDALDQTLNHWRRLMGDPEATLPWSCHLNVVNDDDPDLDGKFRVTAVIEWDKTQHEKKSPATTVA